MVCPRCASEDLKIVRTLRSVTLAGKYSPTTDVRVQICYGCGKMFKVECKIALVSVFNKKLIKHTYVSTDEYEQHWLDAELTPVKQERLFE